MTLKKSAIALAAVAAMSITATARDQIRIVGSSTVYPFSSSVAEEFGAITKYPTPVVESTGSGGGLKLFCAGSGMNTPDITNASRRIKAKEIKLCKKNGVNEITEALIGYDGIALAQSVVNADLDLTLEHIFLAVAEEVPNGKGGLMKNPYTKWSQIDSSLPNREIRVYGPPKSSGTRDSFEEMTMQVHTKKGKYKDVYNAAGYKKYSKIRQDGHYVDAGENDNLIVQKLTKDKDAVGVFGYSFLAENGNVVKGASINGNMPTPDNIASGKYPISRSMYFYIKDSHDSKVPAMKEYVDLFMSDMMIGDDGILKELGLIPANAKSRKAYQESVANRENITLDDLH